MSDGHDPDRQVSSFKDAVIERLVSFVARSVYRDVLVHEPAAMTSGAGADGPQVIVANHFGGFADAVVLLEVLPERPGIVARDVIWKVPVVGGLMNWVGGIPVHKPEDHDGAARNDQMFGSCYRALEDDGKILIFPEGVTRNEPSIAEVKTGAARIALGARASGVHGLSIVPVGIHYEDKAALRSRVFANVGDPLDLEAMIEDGRVPGGPSVTSNDHDAVRALTDAIDVALRRAAPDYSDWTEAGLLGEAAEVVLRTLQPDPSTGVDIGRRDRLANALADRPEDARAAVCEATEAYVGHLDAAGATDAELAARIGTGRLVRGLIVQLLLGVLLLPFAAVGAVINVVPFLIVKAVGRLRVAPSVLSTVKPLTAILAFGLTWGILLWLVWREFGWQGMLVVFVLLPVYLAAVVIVVERIVLAWRLVRRRRASRVASSLPDGFVEARRAVVDAVVGS